MKRSPFDLADTSSLWNLQGNKIAAPVQSKTSQFTQLNQTIAELQEQIKSHSKAREDAQKQLWTVKKKLTLREQQIEQLQRSIERQENEKNSSEHLKNNLFNFSIFISEFLFSFILSELNEKISEQKFEKFKGKFNKIIQTVRNNGDDRETVKNKLENLLEKMDKKKKKYYDNLLSSKSDNEIIQDLKRKLNKLKSEKN